MSTSGMVADLNLGIQSSYGSKHAVVVTNDLSDEAIERAVRQSEALAKLAPDDPEAMPPLGKQSYVPVNAYFESTAKLTPGDRATVALQALKKARTAGDLLASGFLLTSANTTASPTTRDCSRTTGTRAPTTSSPSAPPTAPARGGRPPTTRTGRSSTTPSVAERAIEKAMLSRNPVAIEPGRYTVDPRAAGRRRPRSSCSATRPTRARPTKGAARSPSRARGKRHQDRREDRG